MAQEQRAKTELGSIPEHERNLDAWADQLWEGQALIQERELKLDEEERALQRQATVVTDREAALARKFIAGLQWVSSSNFIVYSFGCFKNSVLLSLTHCLGVH